MEDVGVQLVEQRAGQLVADELVDRLSAALLGLAVQSAEPFQGNIGPLIEDAPERILKVVAERQMADVVEQRSEAQPLLDEQDVRLGLGQHRAAG